MLDISCFICYVDDKGIFRTSSLESDSKKSLNDVLKTFDHLLATPPIRKDFGHSGDKGQMVAVYRDIPNDEERDFGLVIYFEDKSIRYEPFGPGVLRSFGRADANVIREALKLLASGKSPVEYLKEYGNLETYED